jgi:hypothetical protein
MNSDISKETAQKVAVDFLKKRKNTAIVDVATVEADREDWVVRGTCPIDMEGHPWAEKFEVIVDHKGKIKSMNLALL